MPQNDSATEFEMLENLAEQLESVTLDKEIAEEKVEQLEVELESKKLRIQELEADFEILKVEMDELMEGKESVVTNFQVKKFEEQNELMKMAIIKLRDMLTEVVLEKDTVLKECNGFQATSEQYLKEIEKSEETIKILKEQLDAFVESEKMIDNLTNKTIELEDKLKKSEEEMRHFEEMRIMDEEMVETQKEIELGLREDLDKAFVENTELHQIISTFDKKADEYDQMIHKFQDKIKELNETLKMYQEKDDAQIIYQYDKKLEVVNESLDKLRFELTRTHKEKSHIEQELEKLKADYSQAYSKNELAESNLREFMVQVEQARSAMKTISKQETEIDELKKSLKTKNDEIGILKVRIGMMDKKIEESSKSDDARAQHLQEKYNELMKEMQNNKIKYEKTIEELQAAAHTKEKELKEQKLRLRDIDKKAFLVNHMLGTGSIPCTLTSTVFGAFPDISMSLKWAQNRIRQLEAEASRRLLNEMKTLDVADVISGPITLRLRGKNIDDLELEQMVKESEQLLVESNKYLVEPVDPKPKLIFKNNVVNFNQRVENLKFRFQRFWNRTRPGEDYPRIFTKLSKVENKPKTTTETLTDRCKNILEKWKRQNEEDMKRYGNLLKSS